MVIVALVMLMSAASMCLAAPTVVRPSIVPAGSERILLPHPTNDQIPQEQYFGGVVLPSLTQTVIALAAGLAFLFMIIGGIQILTAYGNEEKVSNGRKTMTFAIVGLVIALLSYAIVSIISAVDLAGPQGGPGTSEAPESEVVSGEDTVYQGEPIQGGVQPKDD